MKDFVIVVDSSSDFTADLRERFDIADVLRGVVYFPDGREELADVDWEKYSPEWYYGSMKERKVLYKTASVPSGETERIFEKYLAQGQDILYIALSSALSSNYQSCKLVAQELLKKYPERKVLCVDSLRYSTALSLLVVMASQKRSQGAGLEETAAFVEEKKHSIHQMGPMDDLFFLTKTGRISNFKAFFGTLAGVNPMADFNHKGLSQMLTKAKGKKTALEATLRYMEKTIVEPEKQIIFVAHSNREAAAQQLVQMVKERLHPREVILTPVGMSCGASIGPGLCAAFYVGNPITQDLKDENEIMAGVMAELTGKK